MTLRKLAFLYAVLLMLFLAGVQIGYRYFIIIPASKETINSFHQRELLTLKQALQKEVSFLEKINYDYSVWDDSYDFISSLDDEFISKNLIDDTFVSLKIDGIFYFNQQLEQVWKKGFDHLNRQSITFEELDIQQHNSMQSIFPTTSGNAATVPQKAGFVVTNQGAVMFATTSLRHSDRTGSPVGYLVFLRKVRPTLIDSLQQLSQLKLSAHLVDKTIAIDKISSLATSKIDNTFSFHRQRVITNPIGEPVLLLNIEHAKVQQLKLLDETVLITLAMLATLPLLMLLFVDRYLLAPVIYAARYIRRMTKSQQYKPILSKYTITEIKALRDDFNELINTINNQQRALEDMALKDGLTNIGNRRSFELFIADSWSRMQRNQHPIAVLMCDIDYFKPFNDNYGHQAGDQALVAVASALDNRINRVSDLVARYGGEEFVLVLADSSKENYEYVVNIVLEAVRQLKIPHHHSKNSQYLTISIGAALVSDIQDVPLSVGFDQLVKAADDALYQAKNDGRDRAVMVDFIASNNEVKFYRSLN